MSTVSHDRIPSQEPGEGRALSAEQANNHARIDGISDQVNGDTATNENSHRSEPIITSLTDTTESEEPIRKTGFLTPRKIIGGILAAAVFGGGGIAIGIASNKKENANAQQVTTSESSTPNSETLTNPTPENSTPNDAVPTHVDIANLPSNVPFDIYVQPAHDGIPAWNIKLPIQLANPELTPQLFGNEVLLSLAVAHSVPRTSPAFKAVVELLGSEEPGASMEPGLLSSQRAFMDISTSPAGSSQSVIYDKPEAPAVANIDKAQQAVTFKSDDGKSGVWEAIDVFPDGWQASSALTNADNHAAEWDNFTIGYGKKSDGTFYVSSMQAEDQQKYQTK